MIAHAEETIAVLREEIALLRAETGRCDSVFRSRWTPRLRCMHARGHLGRHLAFGVGVIAHASDEMVWGRWFQEW